MKTTSFLAAGFALLLAIGGALAQLNLNPPAATTPGAPKGPAPAAPAPAAAAGQNETPRPTVERVNAYFNAIGGMTADFVQIGPDGRRWEGKLSILRPGKMRFEYKPPSPLEIISDGTTVAVRDRKANTQDEYFVGQTPLKFLLRDRIDVARDAKVISLAQQGSDAVLVIEDRQTVGGTSRIRLTFNNADMMLKQWIVTDPQGYDTRVQLANIDTTRRPNAALFVIPTKVSTPN
ncbi:MAG TPA: outer-membrane lipoprotein carrier protein LolA [Beijerinckiaceae bacterium]|nr:outer-membrane lipoprotein carrier protein LolA [Beijerinckiaceae bacterium]